MKTKEYKKTFSLRIILIPDSNLSTAVAKLATTYSSYGETYFNIGGKKYIPHLTVFFGSFPIAGKGKVFSVIENISKKYTSLNLEYKLTKGLSGWLWIEFKLKGDLKKMHKEILSKLSPLGKVHPYNMPENYRPHISLLRYKNHRLSSKISKLKLGATEESLKAPWIYLAIADSEEHGTVSKLIKKYRLK